MAGEYRFTVKESGNGVPWIAAELGNPSVDGALGLELRADTPREEAEKLARVLSAYVVTIGLTQGATRRRPRVRIFP